MFFFDTYAPLFVFLAIGEMKASQGAFDWTKQVIARSCQTRITWQMHQRLKVHLAEVTTVLAAVFDGHYNRKLQCLSAITLGFWFE
jgi:hypothetical protein